MKIPMSLEVAIIMVLSGCAVPISPHTTVKAILGEPFVLKMGQSAEFADGMIVTFERVPTDGRCSSCTASYYAQVDLSLKLTDKPPVAISLKTPPLSQVVGDPSPYRIELVKLEPQRMYPPDAIDKADYTVTLRITK